MKQLFFYISEKKQEEEKRIEPGEIDLKSLQRELGGKVSKGGEIDESKAARDNPLNIEKKT